MTKRCVIEKVKMYSICFCMCVVCVFWFVKHRHKKKKKSDLPTLIFFLCYANQTIFFFRPYKETRFSLLNFLDFPVELLNIPIHLKIILCLLKSNGKSSTQRCMNVIQVMNVYECNGTNIFMT